MYVITILYLLWLNRHCLRTGTVPLRKTERPLVRYCGRRMHHTIILQKILDNFFLLKFIIIS
jgi:hypothetical protein